ncbi:MAG: P1 family peptidase [Bryobacteraceae bacterium]|nr:P1 family peptidase [Bryobacteraceae bacterium]
MKGITDVPGILVGHASDYEALTGCTAILCKEGAMAGVDIRGSATGTSELDVLNPLHITTHIHGICFAGGSAFGLEAASGVRRWLERKGYGFQTKWGKVPLVPAAILYDLGVGKPDVRPNREMGEAAAEAATDGVVREGCVGAGTGATIGKALGLANAMKSGLGSASASVTSSVTIGALAAVNPFGDVVQPRSKTIIAGARTSKDGRAFANTSEMLRRGAKIQPAFGNTTLVVVATNARLSKVEATKLAQLSHHGMIQAISPVHTIYDGDLVIALSTGSEQADFTVLGIAAAEVVAEAVVRAALAAWTAGGLPGLAPAPHSEAKSPLR